MGKPVRKRDPRSAAELPEELKNSLDWIVEAVLKGAGKLPRGYNRDTIGTMIRAMAKRSIKANGPDFPPDTFINSSS
jgi:hypothetical protein